MPQPLPPQLVVPLQTTTPPPDELIPPSSMPDTLSDHSWTQNLPKTAHVQFFCNTKWERTALGPLSTWPPDLRLFTSFVLAESQAACLWWGPIEHLTAIYNEPYSALASTVHPMLMGSTFQAGYPDLYDGIKTYFGQALETGTGINYSSSAPLVVERQGWREEAFFSGSFVPVGMPTRGFINSTFEVTDIKLAERRTQMLNLLSTAHSESVDAVYAHIITTLATNPHDVTAAMLYRFEEKSKALYLEGQLGLPAGHRLIVERADINSMDGLIPDLQRAESETIIIEYDNRFEGVSWRGWGDPSKHIAVIPITSPSRTFGYLVFGMNPLRPHDDACMQFTKDLGRMVSSIVSSAVEIEARKKRQEQLEADLAFSDLKLRHLIEHASVGMVNVSIEGHILWANDRYYELAGKTAREHAQKSFAFLDVYHEEDHETARSLWNDLCKGVKHPAAELRLKRSYVPPIGDPEPAAIQVLAFPYFDEKGNVRSVMACTTDISKLKWAQVFQTRLAAEAREAKRQQEAFIDVVSHEMRNPLSAIVHCADSISSALEEYEGRMAEIPTPCLNMLNDNIQSAKVILQCANHQKRIIDDVLTLSKLDSMLLSVTPVPVQPTALIDSIGSIFATELRNNKIAYNVNADSSFTNLRIDSLYLDPSRVTQVFINLLTNAIKFVKQSQKPTISIRFGVCQSKPRTFFPNTMFWASEHKQNLDIFSNPEWGTGEELYLTFSVTDSGIGLKETEIHKIFERFRQANVKTHVKYGGSGLGLFISKELTEKQGGEIGVSSVLGQGSTFGFYIKCRRVLNERRASASLPMRLNGLPGPALAPKQLNVLLVEDNIINQQVLSKQLKRASCKVDVANHGLEALTVLKQHTFDIVLMDLEMPVLDGLDAIRQIRQKETSGEGLLEGIAAMQETKNKKARLPIIAVTANVRKEQIDTAIAAGADRVMRKPFKAAELVNLMKTLLPQEEMPAVQPPTPGPATLNSDGLIP